MGQLQLFDKILVSHIFKLKYTSKPTNYVTEDSEVRPLDPDNIYYQAIPPLTDRIMILERRKQLFGTNWYVSKNGETFLIPVENFTGMNKRRAEYGLEPARRPRNLAKGAVECPLGKGIAKITDQKPLTNAEYEEYSRYSLRYIGGSKVD